MPGTTPGLLALLNAEEAPHGTMLLSKLDQGLLASREGFVSLIFLLIMNSGHNINSNYLKTLESDIKQEKTS